MVAFQDGSVYGRVAAEEIPHEGLAVKLNGDDRLELCGAGEVVDGVSKTRVDAGTPCSFVYDGFPLARLGAAVETIGTPLTPAADGEWVPAQDGDHVSCIARQVGEEGERIRVQMLRRGTYQIPVPEGEGEGE